MLGLVDLIYSLIGWFSVVASDYVYQRNELKPGLAGRGVFCDPTVRIRVIVEWYKRTRRHHTCHMEE